MNELRTVEKVFEGQALSAYLWEGAPVWVAKELGRVMGYGEEGKGLVQLLRQEWKEELIEGTDFELLEGERLIKFKERLGGITPQPTPEISPFAPSLLLLKESGFHLVCLKTEKPVGRRLRRWLADEVMPSLVRTGGYQRSRQRLKDIFEAHRPAILEAMAKKASEGNVEAAQLYLKLGRPSHHKQPVGGVGLRPGLAVELEPTMKARARDIDRSTPGLTLEQIARELGCCKSTVSKALHRKRTRATTQTMN